jgi:hypothetical protein
MSGKAESRQALSTAVYTQRAGSALIVIPTTRFTKLALDIQMLAADDSHAARPSVNQRPSSCEPLFQHGRSRHRGRGSFAHSFLPPITSWSSFESRELYHASR